MKNLTDELFILKRMSQGDVESFKYFFEKYYDDLCNYVNIFINRPELTEEIVQDVFVYFWEKRETLTINKSVKSYLFVASKNKCLNTLRSSHRIKVIDEEVNDNSLQKVPASDVIIEANELQEMIDRAINSLPPRCQEIFVLSREEYLTNKEIAKKLDISLKTVENQKGIAFSKLKEQLRPFYAHILNLILFFFMNR